MEKYQNWDLKDKKALAKHFFYYSLMFFFFLYKPLDWRSSILSDSILGYLL